MVFGFRVSLLILVALMLNSCGSGGGSSKKVVIDGIITFDKVGFSELSLGLDYDNVEIAPARGIQVVLFNDDGEQAGISTTDDNGYYRFSDQRTNNNFRVVARALLSNSSGPVWNVSVRDNTRSDALYVLRSSEFSSGSDGVTLNMHAASGWDASLSSYIGVRSAAPFAILDAIYDGIQTLISVNPDVFLSNLDVFWSENNRPAFGAIVDGNIGSTSYRNGAMYVLGADGQNTDEYDRHVILHEWMHFLEDVLSRSDTIGGRHTITQSLDFRLAFSEGLANAFSGIAVGSPLYRDSFGASQSDDFQIDLEANPDASGGANAGWYVEGSIHSLIYDLYDENNESDDNVSLGLQPIYDVLTSQPYIDQEAFATIFSFGDELKQHPLVTASDIDDIFSTQNIFGIGPYGVGETNDDGLMETLPVYKDLIVDGLSVEVCSTNIRGEINRLGNRQFVRFSTLAGSYTVNVSRRDGLEPSNPAFIVYRQGQMLLSQPQPDTAEYLENNDVQNASVQLNDDGDYILEVLSRSNIDGTFVTGGDVCFDVSVSS